MIHLRRFCAFFKIVTRVALLCLLWSVAGAQELSLRFKVEDEKWDPLKRASVKLLNPEDLQEEFKTGSDGLCGFHLKLNRKYNVLFTKDGYESRVITINTAVPPAAAELNHDFPPIRIQMNRHMKDNSIIYASISDINFSEESQAFAYKSKSTKLLKELKIQTYYFNSDPNAVEEDKLKKLDEQQRKGDGSSKSGPKSSN